MQTTLRSEDENEIEEDIFTCPFETIPIIKQYVVLIIYLKFVIGE